MKFTRKLIIGAVSVIALNITANIVTKSFFTWAETSAPQILNELSVQWIEKSKTNKLSSKTNKVA